MTTNKYKILLPLIATFIFTTRCNNRIQYFNPKDNYYNSTTLYEPVFNKKDILQLKSSLPTLYKFLQKNHLWQLKNKRDNYNVHLCSEEFYQYCLDSIRVALYEQNFFEDYNNLTATFGRPTRIDEFKDRYQVVLKFHPPHIDDIHDVMTIGLLEYDKETLQMINNPLRPEGE